MNFFNKIGKDVTIKQLNQVVEVQKYQINVLHNTLGERNTQVIELSRDLKQLKLDRLKSQIETVTIVS